MNEVLKVIEGGCSDIRNHYRFDDEIQKLDRKEENEIENIYINEIDELDEEEEFEEKIMNNSNNNNYEENEISNSVQNVENNTINKKDENGNIITKTYLRMNFTSDYRFFEPKTSAAIVKDIHIIGEDPVKFENELKKYEKK